KNLEEIGASAFCDTGITSLFIPDSLKEIGKGALQGCSSLTEIYVGDNNEKFSSDEIGVLFNKEKTELLLFPASNKRTEYNVPAGVGSIGDEAFAYSKNLKKVTLPDTVTKINRWAFIFCENLESINIPDGVKDIDDYALFGCLKLKSVTLSKNVETIGEMAFGLYYDEAEETVKKVDGFTLYCYSGSSAETYAKNSEIKYVLLDAPALKKGDVNGDGEVDSLDATAALKYDAGIIDLSAEQMTVGDVNGDGEVDSLDAILIFKYDAGIIDEL
ncbi:MAG: leucine-rich repeat protein, partial [Clostridia bacterium]|nr:leucine-rich repeat protein [Clostridia bacterium]